MSGILPTFRSKVPVSKTCDRRRYCSGTEKRRQSGLLHLVSFPTKTSSPDNNDGFINLPLYIQRSVYSTTKRLWPRLKQQHQQANVLISQNSRSRTWHPTFRLAPTPPNNKLSNATAALTPLSSLPLSTTSPITLSPQYHANTDALDIYDDPPHPRNLARLTPTTMSYSLPGFALTNASVKLPDLKTFHGLGGIFDGTSEGKTADGGDGGAQVPKEEAVKGMVKKWGWGVGKFERLHLGDKEVEMCAAEILPHITNPRTLRNAITLGNKDTSVRWTLALNESLDELIKSVIAKHPESQIILENMFPLDSTIARFTVLQLISEIEPEAVRSRPGGRRSRRKANQRSNATTSSPDALGAGGADANIPENLIGEDQGRQNAVAVAEGDDDELDQFGAHVFCDRDNNKLIKTVHTKLQNNVARIGSLAKWEAMSSGGSEC
ncbi:hypothetical protein BJ508DRAFT_380265 [Ascobolus immersus RN42]|uniref:Uncharacterized protein n=1 Tax=Ascobolus immersus RN42 TaxID=1160509 RepID=A0A3N4HZK1_ASCIM|nr:hypothetical protein BJ508DRAFT_380265 [Ascobolus immersus RN42]